MIQHLHHLTLPPPPFQPFRLCLKTPRRRRLHRATAALGFPMPPLWATHLLPYPRRRSSPHLISDVSTRDAHATRRDSNARTSTVAATPMAFTPLGWNAATAPYSLIINHKRNLQIPTTARARRVRPPSSPPFPPTILSSVMANSLLHWSQLPPSLALIYPQKRLLFQQPALRFNEVPHHTFRSTTLLSPSSTRTMTILILTPRSSSE